VATTFSAPGQASIGARAVRLGVVLIGFPELRLAPLAFLAIRLWMAEIFFRSGLLKVQNLSGAVFLFTEVHPVPFLAPWLAACLVTTIELVCPTLLALGLAARLAALPMLVMALVIQFVVGSADPAFT
jgi:putative oxidoreductase